MTDSEPLVVPRFMILRAACVLALGFVLGYGVANIQFSNTITDLKVKVVQLEDDYLDLLDRQEDFENGNG